MKKLIAIRKQSLKIYKLKTSSKRTTMKTMTCKQLGGACEMEFHANTFEEMAQMSKKHGTEMFQKGDEAHLKAMNEMQELMKTPDAMKAWFEKKKREFDALQ
jgi:hypothetical protein